MQQQNDFSKGSIPRTVTRLAIPMIAAMMVNALYSVVDRFYIFLAPVTPPILTPTRISQFTCSAPFP